MTTTRVLGELPSKRWACFDGWDYNGMKERLQAGLERIDKLALVRHAESIKGQKLTMSQPFSASEFSICFEMVVEDKSLVIGKVRLPRHPNALATATEEDEAYSISSDYFSSLANAATFDSNIEPGAFVFLDIVNKAKLFRDTGAEGSFPLNHMDLGTHNILVDKDFNFVAVIDWGFAHTAPWQVTTYPKPLPLPMLDEDELRIQGHLARENMSRQAATRRIYHRKFEDAESELEANGRPLKGSFAAALESPASRIYACFMNLGRTPADDMGLMYKMARLAFGLDPQEAEDYVQWVEQEYCPGDD